MIPPERPDTAMPGPHFASALSTAPAAPAAEGECLAALSAGLGGRTPDLLVFFVTHHYGEALDRLGERLADATGAAVVAGCTGASIVGGAREIEGQPALSVWAAALPETAVRASHLEIVEVDGGWAFTGMPEVREPERASILLFADPYTFPMAPFLRELSNLLPGVPAVGGMASGGNGPHENLLFHDGDQHASGAVAVVLEGAVEVCTSVSQGCRPIGEPLVITSCKGNTILKLRGKSAAEQMLGMMSRLDEPERELFRRGPFVGLAIDATKSAFEPADLLVRNVVGLNPKAGGVAVGDGSIRAGQTIQFMVRDSASATEELEALLAARAPEWIPLGAGPSDVGSLLITCGGRGAGMFGGPDHDASRLQNALGPDLPVAGFFANGEIGPVAGRNFLHGFSASIAYFRRRAGG